MQTGTDQFVDVMGRDIGRHAHRDPAGAVGQQMRKRRRQNRGFLKRRVIVRAEIDRVFGQPLHQGFGNRGQARLGISAGGGVIAVDVAKVPLPVHQRIADVEILCQTRHRVVNRGLAMGVKVTHDIATDLGGFPETTGR